MVYDFYKLNAAACSAQEESSIKWRAITHHDIYDLELPSCLRQRGCAQGHEKGGVGELGLVHCKSGWLDED
jgi:hypothetical protein